MKKIDLFLASKIIFVIAMDGKGEGPESFGVTTTKIYCFSFSRFLRVSKSDLGLAAFVLLLAFIVSNWYPTIKLVLLAEIFFVLPLAFILNYMYKGLGICFTVQEGGTSMIYHNKWLGKTIQFSEKDIKASECYHNSGDFQFYISSKYFYYKIILKSGDEIFLNSFVVDDLANLFPHTEYRTVTFPFIR